MGTDVTMNDSLNLLATKMTPVENVANIMRRSRINLRGVWQLNVAVAAAMAMGEALRQIGSPQEVSS